VQPGNVAIPDGRAPVAAAARPSLLRHRADALALGAIVLVYLAGLPFSITHLDLARDVGIALDIARGTQFPLEGPVLASSFHLGPIWYYLLALPLWFTGSWLATIVFVGVLSASKFVLAYAVGARLVDRMFGLLWALALLLPGWNTFETMLMLHTSLIAAAMLMLAWCVVRFQETGSAFHAAAAGLLLALTLHAHPSTYGLVLVAGLFVAYRALARNHRIATCAAAAAAFVVPFVPYLVAQARTGFPDVPRAASYLAATDRTGSLFALPAFLRGVLLTGPEAIAGDFFGERSLAPWFFGIAYALVGAVALAGLARWLVRGVHRPLIGATVALIAWLAISVVVVRQSTPYYMTFVVLVPLAGLIALGLRASLELPLGRRLVAVAAAIAATLATATAFATSATLAAGAYPFAFYPLFDVKLPRSGGAPLPFVPAYAIAGSGDRLCPQREIVVHGAYAVHLLHDYAIEAALRCARGPVIHLIGRAPDGAPHIVGMSATIEAGLGLHSPQRLGPLALMPVEQVIAPAVGAVMSEPRRYPPAVGEYGPQKVATLTFDAGAGERVLVTQAYFAFAPGPSVVASVDGTPVGASARDALTTAFACPRCDPATRHRWTLDITTTAMDRIDVVTVTQ